MELMSIEEAAWHIRNGSVIAYPTETVYGLGTIIYDENAVKKLREIKGINQTKPLSVLISKNNFEMLNECIDSLLPVAQRLAKFFWPGPLTIIHKSKTNFPDYITGGTGFIGLRCSPNNEINDFIDMVGHPIISTSANLTGQPPATNIEEVFSYFSESIDGLLIFDDLEKTHESYNVPSTIIKVDQHNFELIREGAIKKSDILRKIYD